MQPGDLPRRTEFYEWVMLRGQEDFNFLGNIIWSDEAKFSKNGMFNRHNSYYWCDQNPCLTREVHFQDEWSFNVFCALKNEKILCFHIYQENLNSDRYLEILRNIVVPATENPPLQEYGAMYYQQDGAPAHNARIISEFLDATFPGNWIGNREPYLWPARSPDLSPLDFFLWGYPKGTVYARHSTTKEDMIARVRNTLQGIELQVIRNSTRENLRKRVELCLEHEVAHFEHVLKKIRFSID